MNSTKKLIRLKKRYLNALHVAARTIAEIEAIEHQNSTEAKMFEKFIDAKADFEKGAMPEPVEFKKITLTKRMLEDGIVNIEDGIDIFYNPQTVARRSGRYPWGEDRKEETNNEKNTEEN